MYCGLDGDGFSCIFTSSNTKIAHDTRLAIVSVTSCENFPIEKAVVTWAENTEWRSFAIGSVIPNELKYVCLWHGNTNNEHDINYVLLVYKLHTIQSGFKHKTHHFYSALVINSWWVGFPCPFFKPHEGLHITSIKTYVCLKIQSTIHLWAYSD